MNYNKIIKSSKVNFLSYFRYRAKKTFNKEKLILNIVKIH